MGLSCRVSWAYLESTPVYDYDPDQASLLLKTAGYVVTGEENPVRMKDEMALRFFLSYPDDDLHQKIAEQIKSDWQTLSVEVVLEPVPPDTFLSAKLEPRAYQAALVDLNFSATPDPDPYPFWDLGQAVTGQNYSQWNNELPVIRSSRQELQWTLQKENASTIISNPFLPMSCRRCRFITRFTIMRLQNKFLGSPWVRLLIRAAVLPQSPNGT